MLYYPHQLAAAEAAYPLLRDHGLVNIHGEPRTGKTRASFRLAEMAGASKVLFLTKKAAIAGIKSEYDAVQPNFVMTCVNYEQVTKLDDPTAFDLAIIDESHNLGTRGRPTNRVKDVRAVCYNLPVILLSGTPTIETPLSIYHQWCITKYSPLRKYKNFYRFFDVYGIPDPVWVQGRTVEQYKRAKPELAELIKQHSIIISQDDAGIEYQTRDQVHTVPLEPRTKVNLQRLEETGLLGKRLVFDTDMGVRTALHQVEAGAVLYEDELLMLPNTEVIDYCHQAFGDSPDVAYFTHFRSTREKFRQHFSQAKLFSSVAHAEGVDMSHMKHMVVVNTGYSGAKAAQLRERVVNLKRDTEAVVHYITTDAGVSRDVYDAVSRKVYYNLSLFRKRRRVA